MRTGEEESERSCTAAHTGGAVAVDMLQDTSYGQPSWFSPLRLLALFCTVNLLVYLDRGMISSNGVNGSPADGVREATGMQASFHMSKFQNGLLPAAFMVGLVSSSLVFAEASKRYNAMRMMGIGLGAWTIATALCGTAQSYEWLLVARMGVGVGEASFIAVAAPFIDDVAPARVKTIWLSTFYLCIPVGYALGYIYGGVVGTGLGWRAAFNIESVMMIPIVAFCCFAAPLDLRKSSSRKVPISLAASSDAGALPRKSFFQQVYGVLCEVGRDVAALGTPVYITTVLGNTLQTAVLGAYAYWGPMAGRALFHLPRETADMAFGAVTVATGVVGTLAGGAALDFMGATLKNGCLICTVASAIGTVLLLVAFLCTRTFSGFMTVFAAGELFMFSLGAPVTALQLWSVPTRLRPLACSVMMLCMHMMGDVPSPPALGALQGYVHDWRISMSALTCLLALSGSVFGIGALLAGRAWDFRAGSEAQSEARRSEGPSVGEPLLAAASPLAPASEP